MRLLSISRVTTLGCTMGLLLLAPVGAGVAGSSETAWLAFQQRQAALRALGDNRVSKQLDDRVFVGDFERAGCADDSDLDRLPDCVETASGRFVDANDTGTDPQHADSDGDGLRDGDEVLVSETGIDLRAFGVSPLRRDLLIEYDWFDSNYDCGPHSQRPTAAVIERVAAAFAAAPVLNPDGSYGIHVVQDFGQDALFSGGNRIEGFDAILPGDLGQTYYDIKQQNFDPARLGYFRYVLLPHRYGGGLSSSGYAEIVGDDAIVSLYCMNSDDNLVRTVLHEVGHLLGLHHGGFEACNHKPNYNSLMNYRYQFSGVDTACAAVGDPSADDYSHGERMSIDEAAVFESQGVCGSPAIDWNGNGLVEDGVSIDLNPGWDASCGAELQVLRDFDDWQQLTFLGLADRTGALKSIQTSTSCAAAPPAGNAAG